MKLSQQLLNIKPHHLKAHMDVAYRYAELSTCSRKKVGCIIINDNNPISNGWNGPPPDDDNECEQLENGILVTKPNVVHAEDNALRKLTGSSASAAGGTLVITLAPCFLCAPRIVAAKINNVVYDDSYRCDKGIKYLVQHNVKVFQINELLGEYNND